MHGILKIAKKESDKAVKIWQHLSVMHKFTERHFNYIVKAIASSLAKESHPNAWEWLNKIHHDYKDQEIYNLQLVLALKQSRWDRIIKIYETELPNNFKEQEKWLYWYARSLEMQNRPIEGKNILIGLSNKRSYYGFLSSAKLLRPYSFKFKAVNINASQIEAVLKNKSVQRAYELLQIDRINKASQEWSFALKNMVEWELHAAAKLADSLNIPNWAITALSDAKQQDDLSLRFPKHYSQHIVNEAKKNQLDPAWVFAVTRQESAFKPYVKSYAGALGLMQLMPQTGYMVAKTINLHLRNHYDILDINNNVKLGSKYLQLMLNRYKNMVVATAAYNAGPGRVCKWLPPHDIAADIWVETIPFKDTKEYVQNVMAHTVIYQKLLGNNHYLNMPLIKKI
jgi:soluble lytic murein transglycosylase